MADTATQLRAIDGNGHVPDDAPAPSAADIASDAIKLAFEAGRTQGRLEALNDLLNGRIEAIERRLDERDAADRRQLVEGVRDLEDTVRGLVQGPQP